LAKSICFPTEYYVIKHCSRNFFFWHRNTENTGRKASQLLTPLSEDGLCSRKNRNRFGSKTSWDCQGICLSGEQVYSPQQCLSENPLPPTSIDGWTPSQRAGQLGHHESRCNRHAKTRVTWLRHHGRYSSVFWCAGCCSRDWTIWLPKSCRWTE